MFTVLGVDWGSKSVGLAVGQPDSGLILPHTKSVSLGQSIDVILDYTRRHPINTIVIGMPEKLNGQPTAISRKILAFAEDLHTRINKSIKITFINERESSKKSEIILDRRSSIHSKGAIHNQSASVILQTYFDTANKNNLIE